MLPLHDQGRIIQIKVIYLQKIVGKLSRRLFQTIGRMIPTVTENFRVFGRQKLELTPDTNELRAQIIHDLLGARTSGVPVRGLPQHEASQERQDESQNAAP